MLMTLETALAGVCLAVGASRDCFLAAGHRGRDSVRVGAMFRCMGSVLFLTRVSYRQYQRALSPRIVTNVPARDRGFPVGTDLVTITGQSTFTSERHTGRLSALLHLSGWPTVTVPVRRSSTRHQPTSSEPPDGGPESGMKGEGSGGKPSKAQQLRSVFREYGAVGVCFHISISLVSLGAFYLAVSSGLDMASLLCSLGFSEAVVRSKMAAGTSSFLLAYAAHKLFAPLRISITLVCVPLIVRQLRRRGLFRTS